MTGSTNLLPIIQNKDRILTPLKTSPLPSPSAHFSDSINSSNSNSANGSKEQVSYFSPITPNQSFPSTPLSSSQHGILLNSILLANVPPPSTTSTNIGGIGASINRIKTPETNLITTNSSSSEFNSSSSNTSSSTSTGASSTNSSTLNSPNQNATKRPQSPSDSIATLTLNSSNNNNNISNSGSITPISGGNNSSVKHCTFAPLPKVDPSIARRNSVALGVAARAKLINSLESESNTPPTSLDDSAIPSSTSTTSNTIPTTSTSSINNNTTSTQSQPSPNRSRSHSPSPTSSRRSSSVNNQQSRPVILPLVASSSNINNNDINAAGLAGILNSGFNSINGNSSHGGVPVNSVGFGTVTTGGRSGSTSPTLSRKSSFETGLSLHYIQGRSASNSISNSGILSPNGSSNTSAIGFGRDHSRDREREDLGGRRISPSTSHSREPTRVIQSSSNPSVSALPTVSGNRAEDFVGNSNQDDDEEVEILAHVDSKGAKLILEVPAHLNEEVDEDEDDIEEEEEDEDEDDEDDEDDEEEGDEGEREGNDDEDEEEEELAEGEERVTSKASGIEVVRWRS